MIRPSNKRERHHAENPDLRGYRVAIALDRENQPDPQARERVVVYVAALARYTAGWKATP